MHTHVTGSAIGRRSAPQRRLVSGLVSWLTAAVLSTMPAMAHAQEAVVIGTVTDDSGGVMPGVVVTAIHEASGNRFEAITESGGGFRLPVRVGTYRVTAALEGFATLTRTGVEILVGQQATINLRLVPASLSENVTVSASAPLIERTSSTVASNVDPRQMADLPVNGRNFVDLTLLVPGARSNAVVNDEPGIGVGAFQLNVDGLRVTQNQTGGFGQPKYSRDAIAEFEFVANRFDASQGGSSGTLVNAVTKSGTNALSGAFSGYFRNDAMIAEDFVAKRVLPYSDSQFSWTLGGPILKDRLHFFGNYELEREPQTFNHTSAYPSFNFDHSGTRTEDKGLARLDYQFSTKTRLSARANKSIVDMPYDQRYTGGATRHPSSAITTNRHSSDLGITLTQVLGPRVVNEVRGAYAGYYWIQQSIVPWPEHPYESLTYGTPIIQMRGYTIGQAHTNSHEDERQDTYGVRDNMTLSFSKAGRHDVKVGAEYFYQQNPVFLCNRCMGIYDAQGGPVPANIEALFPVWNDVSTWNLAALSPIVRSYTLGVGQMKQYAPLHSVSSWFQDDWQISSKLTLNLGVRYDLMDGVYAEEVELLPFLKGGRANDTNNWAPRVGAAFALNDRTVIRGGGGRFFSDPGSHSAYWTKLGAYALHPQILNDGRPDFAANPFNGPIPTFEQVENTLCTVANVPGCLRRSLGTFASNYNEIPYSNQASFGVQRQFGSSMSLEADYVYTGLRAQNFSINSNIAYNPATGVNYPFTRIDLRPYPAWGSVSSRLSVGESNYHGLQMAFTKRMSHHWQASATYLLSGQWDRQTEPIPAGCQYVITLNAAGQPVCDVPVALHETIRDEWFLTGDQRHRASFNGIWDVGKGFQVSGLFLFGDAGWATPTSGVDALQTGGSAGRVRANGTVIARNSFDLPNYHRTDVRVQRRFGIGRAKLEGIVEVFNVFNHANYGTFVLNESNSRFGQPDPNLNVAYQPRMVQLGFRASF
jgi:Carboxypeptidase regulatory-like domain/TonB dependent receptor